MTGYKLAMLPDNLIEDLRREFQNCWFFPLDNHSFIVGKGDTLLGTVTKYTKNLVAPHQYAAYKDVGEPFPMRDTASEAVRDLIV